MPPEEERTSHFLKKPSPPVIDLLVVLSLVCLSIIVVALMIISIFFQYINYSEIIRNHLTKSVPPNYALVLAFARALDFAVLKTSTVFVGFLLTLVGALYVLRIAQAEYSLSLEAPGATRLSLHTASPGLVLVTLGVVVVLVALNSKSFVSYENETGIPSIKASSAPSSSETTPPPNIGKSKRNSRIVFGSEAKKGKNSESVDSSPRSRGALFRPGTSELTGEGERLLESYATRLLKDAGAMVTIEGEADPESDPETGLTLAVRRANAVRTYLLNRGVSPLRVKVISYGKEPPETKKGGGANLTIMTTN